jgi:hypothetical protein
MCKVCVLCSGGRSGIVVYVVSVKWAVRIGRIWIAEVRSLVSVVRLGE